MATARCRDRLRESRRYRWESRGRTIHGRWQGNSWSLVCVRERHGHWEAYICFMAWCTFATGPNGFRHMWHGRSGTINLHWLKAGSCPGTGNHWIVYVDIVGVRRRWCNNVLARQWKGKGVNNLPVHNAFFGHVKTVRIRAGDVLVLS